LAPTGGSSPKGKARGECARILLGRYQNANQTIACQSKVFSGNKTENETALEVRFEEEDTRIEDARGVSLQVLITAAVFLLGPTQGSQLAGVNGFIARSPAIRTVKMNKRQDK
jgi:hypothetical protein